MRSSSRAGTSMIELIWVFTLTTMLLGVCIAWIHQSTKFTRRIEQHKNNHDAMTRLAWEFRDSVRSCNSISLDEEKKLTLNWKNGDAVTYVIDGTTVLFEERVANSKSTRRETYSLSENLVVTWDKSKLPNSVGLVILRSINLKTKRSEDSTTATETERETLAEELPVELEVRASPNRWVLAETKGDSQ